MKTTIWLSRRLRNAGVPLTLAKEVAAKVHDLRTKSGDEWTVSYLKSAGDTLIWAVTGSGQPAPWVSTKERYPVIFYKLKTLPEEVLLRVAKLARCIRLDQPTRKQVGKVVNAVISPFTGDVKACRMTSYYIQKGIDYLRLRVKPFDCTKLEYPVIGRQFRRIQSLSGPTPVISAPPLLESLRLIKSHRWITSLEGWQAMFYPYSLEDLEPIMDAIEPASDAVGEIHAAQEGGAKLRMYASPFTVIQSALSPIHDWLAGIRRQLKTDCTYDQREGAETAQEWLRSGSKVFSVDLSTATCRFPLEPQLFLLRTLGLPEHWIAALASVCCGKWNVGKELRRSFRRDSLTWVVGQPLGIRPSMSMFSLAHNLLLTGLCAKYKLDPQATFRVLGDDVVIRESKVYEDYTSLIQAMGIPISWNKSHASTSFAEFAGFSITSLSLIRPGQWKPLTLKNWSQLAVDLQRPLRGEASRDMQLAQKLLLFSLGLYTPKPERWGYWLKRASALQYRAWDHFDFNVNAPAWFNRIQTEMLNQLRDAGVEVRPKWRMCGDSLEKQILGDLRSRFPGIGTYVEDLSVFSGSPSSWYVTAYMGRVWSALCCLTTQGVITLEEFGELLETVANRAHSLFYLPPRAQANTGSKLLQACYDVLRAPETVLTDKSGVEVT